MTILAPIYLITSQEKCWKCHTPQKVVALGSPSLRDGDVDMLGSSDDSEAPYLLSNIADMPESLYATVAAIHPRFRKHLSRTAGEAYYANICECGANFGDHYLHSDPGGAFFPLDAEAASRMSIRKLPLDGTFELDASWAQGVEDLIFEHARRE